MPRRSLNTEAKPFEIKVGMGFQEFGGMYQLGDPSMTPANRFRRLINVRLGDSDVISRPGMAEAHDSGTTDVVGNMIEVFENEISGIWFGPGAGAKTLLSMWGYTTAPGGPNFKLANPVFVKIDLGYSAQLECDLFLETGLKFVPGEQITWFHFYDVGTPRTVTVPVNWKPGYVDSPPATVDFYEDALWTFAGPNGLWYSALAIVNRWPNASMHAAQGYTFDYGTVYNTDYGVWPPPWPINTIAGPPPGGGTQTYLPWYVNGTAATDPAGYGDHVTGWSKLPSQDYLVLNKATDVIKHAWGPGEQYIAVSWQPESKIMGSLVGEPQDRVPMDPPIYFQGKWLAVGNSRGNEWPPALAGGQQVFEVTFASKQAPITDKAQSDYPYPIPVPPENPGYWYETQAQVDAFGKMAAKFNSGTLTEVFRMPGQCVAARPLRGSAGLDGKTIRSWVVRTVRNDSPISAAEATKEVLYIGTHGGAPWIAGSWPSGELPFPFTALQQRQRHYQPPRNTITNGEVYSWDGTTLTPEVTTGIGQNVVVACLPDGSVLAVGRTGAKILDARDETWKAVTFPVASATPRVAVGGVLQNPVGPNVNYVDVGFEWIDRITFQGEVYFTGFDMARLKRSGKTIGDVEFYLQPMFHPPHAATDYYVATSDAFVVYKYVQATNTLTLVVNGWDLFTGDYLALYGTPPNQSEVDGQLGALWYNSNYTGYVPHHLGLLAADDDYLYVSLDRDGSGNRWNTFALFDGSTWGWLNHNSISLGIGGSGHHILDALSTSNGIFVTWAAVGGSGGIIMVKIQAGEIVGEVLANPGSGTPIENSPNPSLLDDSLVGTGGSPYAWWTLLARRHDHGRMFLGPK